MKIAGEVKYVGDDFEGAYSNGLTMTMSGTQQRFHTVVDNDDLTLLNTDDGVELKIVKQTGKNAGVTIVQTSITNNSGTAIKLEMLTSFLISGINADTIHRIRSCWSSEGKLCSEKLVDLNFEMSWNHHAIRVEKFGSIGSMPVRNFFPFIALEDSNNQHFTAVQLYSPSSWQIELIMRRDETVTLAGGIADRDFGAWMKTLEPGEILFAPKAVVATGDSLLQVCNNLVEEQTPDISSIDSHMGITFNEYCTTWGDPTIDNLKKIADKLEGKGIQYLVMDSGWYLEKEQYWWDYVGKWEVNKNRFPNGLMELTDYIKQKGMIPGIWFEPESTAFGCEIHEHPEHLIKRDGVPLTVGGKRFLDMEDPWVREHLRDTVVSLLKNNNFGYVKIDYNDTIGLGCDGTDGMGENLRKKILASQDFFRELKKAIPNLVIENCSSGGHRLEPSMMELASMASFSDAHETLAIPLIAANLHRVVRPSQSQIWAVLRKEDTDERIYYSMCSTFLGRMGLSGDIYDLSDRQWSLIDEGIAFYNLVSHIIKDGRTIILDTDVKGYNSPVGSQIVVRQLGEEYLAIEHSFSNPDTKKERVAELPDDTIQLTDQLLSLKVKNSYGSLNGEFTAKAWYCISID